MNTKRRTSLDAFTIFSAAAFAGGNLFIGLSMGAYWLSLEPQAFMETFFGQWLRFLATIMPLLLMTLYGLIQSIRCDSGDQTLSRIWRRSVYCFAATILITLFFHMPLNLRLGVATLSTEEAASSASYSLLSIFGSVTPGDASLTRAAWLVGHVPRVLLAVAVSYLTMQAVFERRNGNASPN